MLFKPSLASEPAMDLSTTYLGLELPHPLMTGASPLVDDLDVVKRLEDAGAAAIVMHSVFEEQIAGTQLAAHGGFVVRADRYLEQVRRLKATVGVPVIGSLNGTTPEGWIDYAKQVEDAGADALEMNFYHVATDPEESGELVEARVLDIVERVRGTVRIPIAVKLAPFFSSLPHLAKQLDTAGADGLVLFNRFYQPDIDPEMLEPVPRLRLSTSDDLLLRVRWIAILSGRVRASLAITGGVLSGLDAVKAILAGAHAVQMVTAIYEHGPEYLAVVRRELSHWLDQHEYESLKDAQGSLSLARRPDASSFERDKYLHAVQYWQPRVARP
jgi:dihydroorotate dehydrogenase (fumarate)